MNVDRLSEIASWLEAGAHHEHITFNMDCALIPSLIDPSLPATKHNIRSVNCCIMGIAAMTYCQDLFNDDTNVSSDIHYLEVAQKALGLTSDQAWTLFYGSVSPNTPPQWAAKVIRHLIKTGKVDWDKFRPKGFQPKF